MAIFFLAYEASYDNKKSQGWRLFTSDAESPEDLANVVIDKLDIIAHDLGTDVCSATAFNRV